MNGDATSLEIGVVCIPLLCLDNVFLCSKFIDRGYSFMIGNECEVKCGKNVYTLL
jgi:hypothetical protein